MRLRQWVEQKGRGELTRLHAVTGISYTTVYKLAVDHHAASYEVAAKLSAATGGAVSIAELCELPPATPAKPKPAAKRSKRKRGRRAPSSAVAVAPAARA